MKSWSRYNTLFHSKNYGYFLYNAFSNILLELDEPHFRLLEQLRENPQQLLSISDPDFILLLEEQFVFSDKQIEQKKILLNRYQRNAKCFNATTLSLTICPTLACNFGCGYCFEHSQNNATVMSPKTIDQLMTVIKRLKEIKKLSVTWYGGEPTLAFETIKTLTESFSKLDMLFSDAGMVTNGYLLDKEKISQLNDLKIDSVQITLDGLEATHNKRRMLKNGGATFRTIIDNVEALMNSSYKGKCNIRVNIDKTNQHEYHSLRTELLDRFKGKKLMVDPGHINTVQNHVDDYQCVLCNTEWADFIIADYQNNGVMPRNGFFPEANPFNICMANSYTGFVIGPEGELYKCWKDVGKKGMTIGNIHNEEPIDNPDLVALYSIGTDPFNDDTCLECSMMPICSGGCVNTRLRVQQFGEKDENFCSLYKERLVTYLEAYYDSYRTREILSLMGTSAKPLTSKGYRMVQPAKKETTPGIRK